MLRVSNRVTSLFVCLAVRTVAPKNRSGRRAASRLKLLSKLIKVLFADTPHWMLQLAGAIAKPEERLLANVEVWRIAGFYIGLIDGVEQGNLALVVVWPDLHEAPVAVFPSAAPSLRASSNSSCKIATMRNNSRCLRSGRCTRLNFMESESLSDVVAVRPAWPNELPFLSDHVSSIHLYGVSPRQRKTRSAGLSPQEYAP